MSTSEQSIQVGSLQWFYREAKPVTEQSKQPPVLLLHGIPSQSYCWTALMPDLAQQGLRAIAPDWIGSGFSAKPNQQNFAYTPDAFIQALEDLLKNLEIERFSLVLQGFVGSTGLQYALRHSEQIERLAILNAPLSSAAKLPWKMQQLGLPFIGDMLTQDHDKNLRLDIREIDNAKSKLGTLLTAEESELDPNALAASVSIAFSNGLTNSNPVATPAET
ncbi:MAG: alpha/beta fold hydrolase, partial [Symploca sp. SIO1C4]|nr:alpha/beta fold hydrolase [Symploca sp. SIO1C4]